MSDDDTTPGTPRARGTMLRINGPESAGLVLRDPTTGAEWLLTPEVAAGLLRESGFLVLPCPPDLAAKIDRAATVLGKTPAQFVLEAAGRRVLEVAGGEEGAIAAPAR